MSTTQLIFRFSVDGILTDATSVVLRDPDNTFGVRRADTLAVLVLAGTAMVRTSAGTYAYSVTDPEPGLVYHYWVEAVYAGASYHFERQTAGSTPPVGSFVGRYTTQEQLTTYLHSLNLDEYADLDGDLLKDPGAIQQAIETAEATVDFHTAGPWSFPASTPAINAIVAAGIFEKWARRLAAYEVAEKRGRTNEGEGNQFQRLRDEAIEEMRMFREGDLLLPGTVPDNEPETGGEPGTWEMVDLERGGTCVLDEYGA